MLMVTHQLRTSQAVHMAASDDELACPVIRHNPVPQRDEDRAVSNVADYVALNAYFEGIRRLG